MAIAAHVIKNGFVVNTIVVNSLDELPNLIEATTGGIGWAYDGETLYNPNAPTQVELEQLAWSAVRAERNAKLAACDWTQLSDAPVDDLQWAVYRQALRDVPNSQSDPFSIVWPEPPTT